MIGDQLTSVSESDGGPTGGGMQAQDDERGLNPRSVKV